MDNVKLVLLSLAAVLAGCHEPIPSSSANSATSNVPSQSSDSGSSANPSSSSSSSSGSSSSSNGSTPTAQSDSVTLSWAAPTENTDGSALTNLAGFEIHYGTSSTSLSQTVSLNSVGLLTYVVTNLSAGTWYFEVVAINSFGMQSGPSSIVSVTI